MKVAIRVDASREIGHGHVVRCMALADALGRQGVEVVFMCQQLPGDAVQSIRDAGFLCWLLSAVTGVENDTEQTAELLDHAPGWDWLVVDHYGLSMRWCRGLRARVRHILAIDDLANRLLDCDLLLDQNFYLNPLHRYRGLVPPSCNCLLGPEYALLRPEFARLRPFLRPRDGQVRRLLICFGGADPHDATRLVLSVLAPAFPSMLFDVVVGAAYPHVEALRRFCADRPGIVLTQAAADMPRRMAEADLFVGAGGSMTWERAVLGLPGVTIPIAENQYALCKTLSDQAEGVDMGPVESLDPQLLCDQLRQLCSDPAAVRSMGLALAGRCDGGGAERVARAMLEQSLLKAPFHA